MRSIMLARMLLPAAAAPPEIALSRSEDSIVREFYARPRAPRQPGVINIYTLHFTLRNSPLSRLFATAQSYYYYSHECRDPESGN